MRTVGRGALIVVVLIHGLIHLLGAAHGFGWAEVEQFQQPIGPAMGAVWLATAVLVAVAGVSLLVAARRAWLVVAIAAVTSQIAILTAWGDAWAGTIANIVLLLAAIHGYAAHGPGGYRSEYRRRVAEALAEPRREGRVTETDLADLPAQVATYVRRTGAVGQPHVTGFRARMHGRIRAGADRPWMRFTAEQVSTYGPRPRRLFLMDATMFGLPVDVLHILVDAHATMRVKVASLVRMVDASGPEMDQAETVTLLNDLCILAPAALVHAPIQWETLDGDRVRATYTNGVHTVSAELHFDEHGDLVDFVSDDRLAASADGRSSVPQRWSTPLRGYATFGPHRLASEGEGRWHPDDGDFAYLELHLDDVVYDVGAPSSAQVGHEPALNV